MYTHRNLEHKDLEVICTFPQAADELVYISPKFQYPLTPDQILALLKDRFEPTVILDRAADEVVAYANIYGYDAEERTCWLGNVVVSPTYRGRGASQYLLDVMLNKAKSILGAETIRLACHNTNSRGLAFYVKYGFKPYDINVSKYAERKLIAIHMSKLLM